MHEREKQEHDQDFHVKLKGSRQRDKQKPKAVGGFAHLAEAAARAARNARGGTDSASRRGGYRIDGRQRVVGAPSPKHQLVVVKTHIWYNRALHADGLAAAKKHVSGRVAYIGRAGAGEAGSRAVLFGRRGERDATSRDFVDDAARAPHGFRFIVSPERSDALDLQAFARDLMAQLGADLGVAPHWIGAVHDDTDQRHVHIELSARDGRTGETFKIHEDYLFRGLRYRAQELATRALGLRSEGELCQALGRAALSARATELDRRLMALAQESRGELVVRVADVRAAARAQNIVSAPAMEHYLRARLRHLVELGLAREVTRARYTIAVDAGSRLRDLGRRGDILKNLQIAGGERYNARRSLVVWERQHMIGRWIEGRVRARAFADELTDKELLVVEATDGKTYVIGLNQTSEQLGKTVERDIVRVSGGKKGYPNVYVQVRAALEQQVSAEGRTWLDAKLWQQVRDGGDLGAGQPSGFGAELHGAIQVRRQVLRERGLIKEVDGRDRFVAGFLDKLYAVGLAEFEREHGYRYGNRRAFVAGLEYVGELRVVQLPSGPHALLIERAGYRLTPLRPQMIRHVGTRVGLTLSQQAVERPLDRGARVQVRALERERGRSR